MMSPRKSPSIEKFGDGRKEEGQRGGGKYICGEEELRPGDQIAATKGRSSASGMDANTANWEETTAL